MKKYQAAFVMAIALLAFFQFGCANSQNANMASSNVNMATPAATPDKAAIETELKKIENDWPRIIKEHDATTVRRIEADDAIFVYPDGSLGDKSQDVKDVESGALSADSWEVADLKVMILDSDSAVVTGRSIVTGGKYKTPDGKIQNISGEYRFVDTYARRDGQWQEIAGATVPVLKGPTATASPTPKASPSLKPSPAAKASPAMKSLPPMKPASTPAKMKTP